MHCYASARSVLLAPDLETVKPALTFSLLIRIKECVSENWLNNAKDSNGARAGFGAFTGLPCVYLSSRPTECFGGQRSGRMGATNHGCEAEQAEVSACWRRWAH